MSDKGESMIRRNNKRNRPDDIFGGLEELMEAWMDMMQVIPLMDTARSKVTKVATPKHQGTMSYEEREKDIVFTIDMPGVEKKDIDIKVEDHSITVKAENGGSRKYNYTRKFRPTVDIDSAVATFKNGVLDITLTKIKEASKGKSVKIK